MAQLSYADLIDRRVPLTASEAAALALAASDVGPVPDPTQIFLSSTGFVSFGCTAVDRDDTGRLASLLQYLLGLDENDGADRRARVPGGLLVVLARTMGQIDLPMLSPAAFRESLRRFAGDVEPARLAAIFWRAARMRPRNGRRSLLSRSAGLLVGRRRDERRTQGPTSAELRRWLRQSEREIYRLRQSRIAAASAGVISALVLVVIVGVGVTFGRPAPVPTLESRSPVVAADASLHASLHTVPLAPGLTVTKPAPQQKAAAASAKATTARRPRTVRPAVVATTASVTPGQPEKRPKEKRAVVRMVNLPRATWAVAQ